MWPLPNRPSDTIKHFILKYLFLIFSNFQKYFHLFWYPNEYCEASILDIIPHVRWRIQRLSQLISDENSTPGTNSIILLLPLFYTLSWDIWNKKKKTENEMKNLLLNCIVILIILIQKVKDTRESLNLGNGVSS